MKRFPTFLAVSEGYPLPVDPVTKAPWWRINIQAIEILPGYQRFEADTPMDRLIPVLRWLLHGGIPG